MDFGIANDEHSENKMTDDRPSPSPDEPLQLTLDEEVRRLHRELLQLNQGLAHAYNRIKTLNMQLEEALKLQLSGDLHLESRVSALEKMTVDPSITILTSRVEDLENTVVRRSPSYISRLHWMQQHARLLGLLGICAASAALFFNLSRDGQGRVIEKWLSPDTVMGNIGAVVAIGAGSFLVVKGKE